MSLRLRACVLAEELRALATVESALASYVDRHKRV
jgi:hypothetical protein